MASKVVIEKPWPVGGGPPEFARKSEWGWLWTEDPGRATPVDEGEADGIARRELGLVRFDLVPPGSARKAQKSSG